jgi:hypothetical protein
MNPSARRYLILVSVLASLALTGCTIFLSDIPLIYPLLMAVTCTGSVYYHSKPRRRYSLPILWSIFFIFGYILAFAVVLLDPEQAGIGARRDLPSSAFSDSILSQIYWVMLAGTAGTAFAAKAFELVFGFRRGLALASISVQANFHKLLSVTAVCVFLFSVAIVILMWVLGIGRTGLPPATTLPFMLTGILVYIKNMLIPFLGFLVFVAAERTRDMGRIRIAFLMLMVIGCLGSIAFISRSFLVFMVFPALFYVIFYGRSRILSRQIFFEMALVILGAVLVIIPAIDFLREALYSGREVSFSSQLALSQGISFREAFANVGSLLTARIVGFRELVFITDYQHFDVWAPWRVFSGDDTYTGTLMYALYDFEQDASGETAFGYALGLWGMFYLSGSFFIVFFGSFFAASVVLALEEVFLRSRFTPASLFMAFIVGLWVWGGIDWFLLSRLLVTALFCYCLVRYTRLSALLR